MDRDQGHCRCTGLGKMADVGAQVGHQTAAGGDHLGARQIQLRLLDRRTRAAQLGIVVPASPAASWALRKSASVACSLLSASIRVACAISNRVYRDSATILAVQRFLTRRILVGLYVIGLCRLQRGARCFHRGHGGVD